MGRRTGRNLIAVRRFIRSPDQVNLETENRFPPSVTATVEGVWPSRVSEGFAPLPGDDESVRPLSRSDGLVLVTLAALAFGQGATIRSTVQ